ncbi:hypothetical protein NQZ68_033976 [Dissostichus eleginoides]|nr:hypothetical protein NQZ68_033976 [Dissostichus eleginoides]
MSPRYRSWLWFWSCLLSLSVLTHALELEELFEFGEEAGDQQLKPGSDSTAELPLNGSLYFFGDTFHKVYFSETEVLDSLNRGTEAGMRTTQISLCLYRKLPGHLEGRLHGSRYFRRCRQNLLLLRVYSSAGSGVSTAELAHLEGIDARHLQKTSCDEAPESSALQASSSKVRFLLGDAGLSPTSCCHSCVPLKEVSSVKSSPEEPSLR